MEEGYVVRAMVYQGSDGKFTRHLSQAQLIKDKDLAEAAADLANGWVVPVVRAEKNQSKKKNKKPCKSNQGWMRKT